MPYLSLKFLLKKILIIRILNIQLCSLFKWYKVSMPLWELLRMIKVKKSVEEALNPSRSQYQFTTRTLNR